MPTTTPRVASSPCVAPMIASELPPKNSLTGAVNNATRMRKRLTAAQVTTVTMGDGSPIDLVDFSAIFSNLQVRLVAKYLRL